MRHWPSLLLFLCLLCAAVLPAQENKRLAPTPPMGWNSWDSYGLTISEDQFKANVQWLNQHLKPFGWKYVVIDEGWYLQHPENAGKPGADQGYTLDNYGRYIPAPNRFPSSARGAGLKAIADSVHALGLKFGIHIIRGIPKEAVAKNLPIAGSPFHAADAANPSDLCAWNPDNYGLKNNAAAQAYDDSLAKLYADWGVDFLKVDCISSPYQANEVHMMSAALKKSGRPIVLSLSPGPTPVSEAADVRQYAQMWRISNDVWDLWSKPESDTNTFPQPVKRQFKNLAMWSSYVEPGHWPDADMLPLGYLGPNAGWGQPRPSRLTQDEARTLITLWCIARSPLILGANLTRMDSFTESLLTNPEVINVDQHSRNNRPVVQTQTEIVWTAEDSDKKHFVAAFNISDQPQVTSYTWKQLGLMKTRYRIRDLWQRKNLGEAAWLKVKLAPHASALYEVESY